MLVVVHGEQHLFARQEASDRLLSGLSFEHDDAERPDDCRGHLLGPLQGCECDEPRAVGEVALDTMRGLEREPRLADPARPVSVSSRTELVRSRSPTASSSRLRPTVRFGGAGNLWSPSAPTLAGPPSRPSDGGVAVVAGASRTRS